MASDAIRTVGGIALARLGKSQRQIATEVGVSAVSIHEWINGTKRPATLAREKLLALYGIPMADWTVRATAEPSSLPPPETPRPAPFDAEAMGGAFGMAKALQRQAQMQIAALDDPEVVWTPGEKATVTQKLTGTVNMLMRLTGQHELGRRILQLPVWKQLETEMYEALKPYPEASRAVAERLRRFESNLLGKGEV